jgi:hypothetical protein
MNNPSVALQTAYYTALTSPVISVDGATIPVYSDMAPTSATGSYIVLGQQTFVDDADKQVFGTEATQNVTVVTTFDSDIGGKKLSSRIADLVMQRIRTRARLDLSPEFNMITSTLDSYLTISEQSPTRTIIRAEMRFRHIIEESDAVYLTDGSNYLTDSINFLTNG